MTNDEWARQRKDNHVSVEIHHFYDRTLCFGTFLPPIPFLPLTVPFCLVPFVPWLFGPNHRNPLLCCCIYFLLYTDPDLRDY